MDGTAAAYVTPKADPKQPYECTLAKEKVDKT